MYKLSYNVGAKEVESFIFPSLALCKWKQKQIQAQGTHKLGKLIITKIN